MEERKKAPLRPGIFPYSQSPSLPSSSLSTTLLVHELELETKD